MKVSVLASSALVATLFVACMTEDEDVRIAADGSTDGTAEEKDALSFDVVLSDATNTDAVSCAKGKKTASKLPVYLMMSLDGSGSMKTTNGVSVKKWESLQKSVGQLVDKWKGLNDNMLGIGMSVFQDSNDPIKSLSSDYPSISASNAIKDLPIKMVDASHASAMKARISGSASGATPWLRAIRGNLNYIKNYTPLGSLPKNGKKIFVFMSDGDPDEGACEAESNNPCIDEINKAKTAGVTTYSVLFAYNSSAALHKNIGRLAQAGGGSANANCTVGSTDPNKSCHFIVDSTSNNVDSITKKFFDAVEKIRGEASDPCVQVIEKDPNVPFDKGLVNVTVVDGSGKETSIPKNATNGWTYDNEASPTKVILNGAACTAIKADAKARLDIVFGCKTEEQ